MYCNPLSTTFFDTKKMKLINQNTRKKMDNIVVENLYYITTMGFSINRMDAKSLNVVAKMYTHNVM